MTKILSLVMIGFIVYWFLPDSEYLSDRDVQCTVIDKMEGRGRSTRFYLILKDDKGRVFDLSVSPSTYSQAFNGKKLIFNLREFDIAQTPEKNMIHFFGHSLIVGVSITYTMFFIGYLLVTFVINKSLRHNDKI